MEKTVRDLTITPTYFFIKHVNKIAMGIYCYIKEIYWVLLLPPQASEKRDGHIPGSNSHYLWTLAAVGTRSKNH